MSAIVIDTNVLLVASGLAKQMSDACLKVCYERLERARDSEQVVVDKQFLILGEYQHKLDSRRRPPRPGDAFVLHILQNMANPAKVSTVNLTPTNQAKTTFAEFPRDADLEAVFDPADRKFVAASCSHSERPRIVESADSKWLGWEVQLNSHGIQLEVLCRDELQAIRDEKLSKKRRSDRRLP